MFKLSAHHCISNKQLLVDNCYNPLETFLYVQIRYKLNVKLLCIVVNAIPYLFVAAQPPRNLPIIILRKKYTLESTYIYNKIDRKYKTLYLKMIRTQMFAFWLGWPRMDYLYSACLPAISWLKWFSFILTVSNRGLSWRIIWLCADYNGIVFGYLLIRAELCKFQLYCLSKTTNFFCVSLCDSKSKQQDVWYERWVLCGQWQRQSATYSKVYLVLK